jgi:two-component system sensor histidine kinase MprB
MLTVHGHGRAVQLARDLSDVEQTLNRFAVVLAASDAVVVALTVTLGYALTRTGLRPVEKVRRAAEHVAGTQDLDAAVPITDRDPSEVASVAASVNSMLTALAASRDAQRQLIDDAGHELATPLTSLRTNIDLLVRAENRPEQVLDPQDRRTLLGDLQAQMGELSELIDEIIELARDPRTAEEPERLDLADVLTAAVTRARARTPEVEFVVRSEHVVLSGGRAALERAVLNLLDNAAKFGGDSPVEISVSRTENRATVVVADRGVGIKETEALQVFERFHRSHDARALPGSGLGLSIVAQVMSAHGGRAWLTPRAGGGTEAHLEFPLTP